MPTIRSSTELRNDYNGISQLCHDYCEPVFITKNGKGDLAVMSIETYEMLAGKFELYGLIKEGMNNLDRGDSRPASDVLKDLRSR